MKSFDRLPKENRLSSHLLKFPTLLLLPDRKGELPFTSVMEGVKNYVKAKGFLPSTIYLSVDDFFAYILNLIELTFEPNCLGIPITFYL